jgi:hypothetical protein
MRCNLDARGKRIRLVGGLVSLFIGVVLAALALTSVLAAWWAWTLAVAALAVGALLIYEARAGWCVLRAMGIKTAV